MFSPFYKLLNVNFYLQIRLIKLVGKVPSGIKLTPHISVRFTVEVVSEMVNLTLGNVCSEDPIVVISSVGMGTEFMPAIAPGAVNKLLVSRLEFQHYFRRLCSSRKVAAGCGLD